MMLMIPRAMGATVQRVTMILISNHCCPPSTQTARANFGSWVMKVTLNTYSWKQKPTTKQLTNVEPTRERKRRPVALQQRAYLCDTFDNHECTSVAFLSNDLVFSSALASLSTGIGCGGIGLTNPFLDDIRGHGVD